MKAKITSRGVSNDETIGGMAVGPGSRVVDFSWGGHAYRLTIGRILYTDKRVFSLRRDGQEIQTGTGYKPEHEIEEIIIGAVQGTEPVGTIGVDAHGNVVALVKKGL